MLTDGRKIGRLYRTLLQAGATKMKHIHNNFWKDVLQAFVNIDKKMEINERSGLKNILQRNIKIDNSYTFFTVSGLRKE